MLSRQNFIQAKCIGESELGEWVLDEWILGEWVLGEWVLGECARRRMCTSARRMSSWRMCSRQNATDP